MPTSTQQILANKVAGAVNAIIQTRGTGLRSVSMLEYWLQAEIWRAATEGDLGDFHPAAVDELPYKTSAPLNRKGTGFHWCDIVLLDGRVAIWIEMKDLGRNKKRTRANAVGFVSKNLRPLANIRVEETIRELKKPYDEAHPALKDEGRQDARIESGHALANVRAHLCAGICLTPADGNVAPGDVERVLVDGLPGGLVAASHYIPTAWDGLHLVVVLFNPTPPDEG